MMASRRPGVQRVTGCDISSAMCYIARKCVQSFCLHDNCKKNLGNSLSTLTTTNDQNTTISHSTTTHSTTTTQSSSAMPNTIPCHDSNTDDSSSDAENSETSCELDSSCYETSDSSREGSDNSQVKSNQVECQIKIVNKYSSDMKLGVDLDKRFMLFEFWLYHL